MVIIKNYGSSFSEISLYQLLFNTNVGYDDKNINNCFYSSRWFVFKYNFECHKNDSVAVELKE